MSRRLLPVADPTFPRTANVILPPEHPVWALGSAEEAACMLADSGTGFRFASCCGWSGQVLGWLRATFPHLPVDDVVSADEAAAFAAGAPGPLLRAAPLAARAWSPSSPHVSTL